MERKEWVWPRAMALSVYNRIRKWYNQYDMSGMIHKSRRIPHGRYGLNLPETEVLVRIHKIEFRYPELKWLTDMIRLEDDQTTQAIIFEKALAQLQEAQNSGRIAIGTAYSMEYALTKDEVGWIMKLLECIGIYPERPTPSEIKADKQATKDGDW